MNKFKIKWSYYSAPTPRAMRKLGDSLLAVSTFIALGELYSYEILKETFGPLGMKLVVGGTLLIGVTGKFLTNFFKEVDENT
jgi:hypothetical protein